MSTLVSIPLAGGGHVPARIAAAGPQETKVEFGVELSAEAGTEPGTEDGPGAAGLTGPGGG